MMGVYNQMKPWNASKLLPFSKYTQAHKASCCGVKILMFIVIYLQAINYNDECIIGMYQ